MSEKIHSFHISDNNLSSPPKMMIKSIQKVKGWHSDPSEIDHDYADSLVINSNSIIKKRANLQKKRTFSNFKENNSWNSQLERITKDIGEKADGIKWMHDHDSSVLTLVDNILGILTIIFSVLSIIPSALMGLDKYKDIQLVFLINIALTVITALFAGLKQFLPLKDMSDKHKSAAGRYLQLRNLVKLQLALYRKDRENGKTFVATLQREFNVLFSTSPSITTWTSWRFGHKFKNIKMTKPDAIDGITPIDIRQTTKESNNSTTSNSSNDKHDDDTHNDNTHNNKFRNKTLNHIDLNTSSDNEFIDLEKGEGRQKITTSNTTSTLNTASNDNSQKTSKQVQTTQFSAYNVEKSENEESDEEPDRYITKTDRRHAYEFERFLKNS